MSVLHKYGTMCTVQFSQESIHSLIKVCATSSSYNIEARKAVAHLAMVPRVPPLFARPTCPSSAITPLSIATSSTSANLRSIVFLCQAATVRNQARASLFLFRLFRNLVYSCFGSCACAGFFAYFGWTVSQQPQNTALAALWASPTHNIWNPPFLKSRSATERCRVLTQISLCQMMLCMYVYGINTCRRGCTWYCTYQAWCTYVTGTSTLNTWTISMYVYCTPTIPRILLI